MMKPITDIWRQLVRRRLWPVALLLVGAAAAVPVLLAKEPAVVPPAPPAAATGADGGVLATEPIVALSEPADPDADRRPLGKRHDIFKPTKKAPKPQKAPKVKADVTKTTVDKPAKDKEAATGGSSTGGGTVIPPAPTIAPEKPKTYPFNSLIVRFGDGGRKTLPVRSALPSAAAPLIVYLGLTDRNKAAVFLLDASLKPQGDGECDPTPENCERLHLRAGETEFFDIVDAAGVSAGEGFQLDLVKINHPTDGDKTARSSTKTARVSRVSALQTGFHGEALRRLGVLGRTR